MREVTSIADLPNVPAVYAMYGGQGRSRYVTYVGLATKLRSRIGQHVVHRDSTAIAGFSVVSPNPDQWSKSCWGEHRTLQQIHFSRQVPADLTSCALRPLEGVWETST
jgi:hypothetical protein